jgi:cellulose biosynthesis protein BcsQ
MQQSVIQMPHKQIAFFNHKGGVSKTTTAFNVGWMLAEKGKRVLLVDCDPQCNLTGLMIGSEGNSTEDSLEKLYQSSSKENPTNIRDALSPAFEGKPRLIQPVECHQAKERAGLFLIPGHVGLAEYETSLGVAQQISGSLSTLRNLPGSFRYLISETSNKYNIDYALIDMSPSLGPLNQNLLMTSEFFVIPMAPDFFSMMAINSLAETLPRWKKWLTELQKLDFLEEADYPFPKTHPKFLGYIMQRFNTRNKRPSAFFQHWIDRISEEMKNVLIPKLKLNEFLLEEIYCKQFGVQLDQPIALIKDFGSLISNAQEHQKPVFCLTAQEIKNTGVVLENQMENVDSFRENFSELADKILNLTNVAAA